MTNKSTAEIYPLYEVDNCENCKHLYDMFYDGDGECSIRSREGERGDAFRGMKCDLYEKDRTKR